MDEYLFLMVGGDEVQPSPAELQTRMQRYMIWMNEMIVEDRFVAGQPLEPRGTQLSSKDHVATDGPFLEPKEMVGGYVIVRAESLDDATDLARGCPLLDHCRIQVRPLVTVPG